MIDPEDLLCLLEDLEPFLDDQADCEFLHDGPNPNTAMRLLIHVREMHAALAGGA